MRNLAFWLSSVTLSGALPLHAASVRPDTVDNFTDLFGIDFPTEPAREYADRFHLIAEDESRRTGIPASIKLAQGMLESDFGRSTLAREANNHFGIKCGGDWTGETYYRQDDDPGKSCFRVYYSAEESYTAHSEFLSDPKKASRYGKLFKLDKNDYKAWAYGLKEAGYATSSSYPERLISLIERLDLTAYDVNASKPSLLAGGNGNNTNTTFKPVTTKPTSRPDPLVSNTGTTIVATRVFHQGSLSYIIAQANDTPEKIAAQQGLSVRRIREWNNLDQGDLKAGMKVWLQSKKRRYKGKERTVTLAYGETLYDISQRYGITLKRLHKLNGYSIKTGQIIKLKK